MDMQRLRVTPPPPAEVEYFEKKFTTEKLKASARAEPNMGDLVQREHPENYGRIGVGSLGSTKKPAIAPKRCKIGPRLL